MTLEISAISRKKIHGIFRHALSVFLLVLTHCFCAYVLTPTRANDRVPIFSLRSGRRDQGGDCQKL